MNYRHLFENGKIGSLTLKNRIVMPAMGTNLSGPNGEVTPQQIAYYEERAKGGTGLIIAEFTCIDYEYGKGMTNQLRIDEDRFIPGMHRLANAVHKYGAKMFVQLHHAGRQSNSGLIGGKQIVAPSAVTIAAVGEEPRELTTAEVKELVEKFVKSALRCKQAGIDGVELHAAHGYLINQFLSPSANIRTDEYGGSFENRLRFLKEIVAGIKEHCGSDYPITVRLSVDEFDEGGTDVQLSKKIAQYLENIGINGIHASAGNYNSFYKIIDSPSYPQGWRVYLAEEIKQVVKIPVIAIGVIREPAFANAVIAEGKADFVALGRGHIADPEWARKAKEGRDPEIRRCISCLHCIQSVNKNLHVQCSVNTRAGRELEFTELQQVGNNRPVVIVGGGPGGMEAARILSLKGYTVTLFEKESYLGGQLHLVHSPEHKRKMQWIIDYLHEELKRLKVTIHLNTEATVEKILTLEPYAIFLATGARGYIPPYEGIERGNVSGYEDVLLERKNFSGRKTAVIGSGMVCYSVTGQLAESGSEVTLIEVPTKTGSKVSAPTRAMFLSRLKTKQVDILEDCKIKRIQEKAIILEDQAGNTQELTVDDIVLSMGTESYNPLEKELREQMERVFVLGDAILPGAIGDAIKDGFEKAYVLETLV
ncbi:FAD-dependent oxidoreductase [Bacillus rubiinfantis]|uniref:oxidoreductase n=1 Tax=Bacillus rubiinfantis TaxID=1499680 RepID=UPI0005AA4622|nr:FAD-dependent oxidoreductase [Bacillus rubiinfantis]